MRDFDDCPTTHSRKLSDEGGEQGPVYGVCSAKSPKILLMRFILYFDHIAQRKLHKRWRWNFTELEADASSNLMHGRVEFRSPWRQRGNRMRRKSKSSKHVLLSWNIGFHLDEPLPAFSYLDLIKGVTS